MKVCLQIFPEIYQIIKIQNFKISRNVKLREVNMMMISNIPPLLFVDQIAIGYSVLCERDQLLVYWDIHGKTSCPNLPSAQCFVQIPFDFPASTISMTLHEIPIQVYFVFAMIFSRFSSPSLGPSAVCLRVAVKQLKLFVQSTRRFNQDLRPRMCLGKERFLFRSLLALARFVLPLPEISNGAS